MGKIMKRNGESSQCLCDRSRRTNLRLLQVKRRENLKFIKVKAQVRKIVAENLSNLEKT